MTRNFYLSKTNERATGQVHPLVLLHRDGGQPSQSLNSSCSLIPTRLASRSQGTRRKLDPDLFPSGASLERPKALQTLIDVIAFASVFIFISSVAVALPISIFILLFVRT